MYVQYYQKMIHCRKRQVQKKFTIGPFSERKKKFGNTFIFIIFAPHVQIGLAGKED